MMELREEILNTATELFRTKGLKFTMEDVARDMHVAKKTIYKLYSSKEELLLDLVENGFRKIQSSKQAILNSDLTLKEKIARVLIEMPADYKSLDFRQLGEIEDKYPNVWKEIIRHLESEWEPIYELLNEGKRQGKVYDISLPVLKQIVTSSIDSFLYSDDLKHAGIAYQDALEEMVQILMKGVWNDSAE